MAISLRADTIFADDVRTEMNGKQILIGCYAGDMLLNERPSSPIVVAAIVRIFGGNLESLTPPKVIVRIGNNEIARYGAPGDAPANALNMPVLSEWKKVPNFMEAASHLSLLQLIVPVPIPSLNDESVVLIGLEFTEETILAGALVVRFIPEESFATGIPGNAR